MGVSSVSSKNINKKWLGVYAVGKHHVSAANEDADILASGNFVSIWGPQNLETFSLSYFSRSTFQKKKELFEKKDNFKLKNHVFT